MESGSQDIREGGRLARREAQKRAVVDAALTLLETQGRKSLSARRLAEATGVSTKIIYSHFGGMGGVMEALYRRAFGSLHRDMARAGADVPQPARRLQVMAAQYRQYGLTHPYLFEIMYGQTALALLPDERDRAVATPSLALYADAFAELGLTQSRAREAAYAFWAGTHGCVALELSAWLSTSDVFARICEQLIASALTGKD